MRVFALILIGILCLAAFICYLIKTDDDRNRRYCYAQARYLSSDEVRIIGMKVWLNSPVMFEQGGRHIKDRSDVDEWAKNYINQTPDCCARVAVGLDEFDNPLAVKLNLEWLAPKDDTRFGIFYGMIFKAPGADIERHGALRYSVTSCGDIVTMEFSASGKDVYRNGSKP